MPIPCLYHAYTMPILTFFVDGRPPRVCGAAACRTRALITIVRSAMMRLAAGPLLALLLLLIVATATVTNAQLPPSPPTNPP
eukprot:COSAG06_NODE_36400_length_447_cov_1.350575_2_plen_81_part_01